MVATMIRLLFNLFIAAILYGRVSCQCPWWWCPDPEEPAPPLLSYGADPTQVSVSGTSSGAYMAIQMHVAYSASIMGSGVVAGGPYHCAKGSTLTALQACMSNPNQIDVQELVDLTNQKAQSGAIDPVSNLQSGITYLFSGSLDTVVDPGVMFAAEDYMHTFMPSSNIITDYGISAGHAMITEHYGSLCAQERMPYINDCNHPLAYIMMSEIYGGTLQKPTSYGNPLPGDMLTFDQLEHEPTFTGTSCIDDIGYIYIPTGCRNNPGCKVHISFHGCLQGRDNMDEEYALNTGYNEVGELNNIIIIHPQSHASALAGNGNGCWDWWGYTNQKYDEKDGVQMEFIKNIIDVVTSEHHACGVVRSNMVRQQCIEPPVDPPTPEC